MSSQPQPHADSQPAPLHTSHHLRTLTRGLIHVLDDICIALITFPLNILLLLCPILAFMMYGYPVVMILWIGCCCIVMKLFWKRLIQWCRNKDKAVQKYFAHRRDAYQKERIKRNVYSNTERRNTKVEL